MFAAAVSMSLFASAQAPPVPVTVADPDGNPAAGAKVWCYPYSERATVQEPKPVAADAAGRATVGGPAGQYGTRYAFARDAAGRVGSAQLSRRADAAEGVRIVVRPVAARAGRVTGADGKPVAGARVRLTAYSEEALARKGYYSEVSLPPWIPAQVTGPDGRFDAPAPEGFGVYFRVEAEGFGEATFLAAAAADPAPVLLRPGRVELRVAGVEPAKAKGAYWSLRASDESRGGTRAIAYKAGTLDGTPTQAVEGLYPGRYDFAVQNGGALPVIAQKSAPVEVPPGGSATATASFGPAATITGRVVGPDGKGVGRVQVSVSGTDAADSNRQSQYLTATTAADGTFAAHGPAAWYAAGAQPPDGLVHPSVPRRGQGRKAVRVELGQSREVEPIRLIAAKSVAVRAVLEGGKPAAGAKVSAWTGTSHDYTATADADGRFAVKNLPPDDAFSPRIRLGDAVNLPEAIEVEKAADPVVVEVSPRHAAGFAGKLADPQGRPVAGAKVTLRPMVWGVGRNSDGGIQRSTDRVTIAPDAQGRYEFRTLWAKDRYSVLIAAPGFADAEIQDHVGVAGKVTDLGTTTLTRAGLVVKGTVRDAAGQPVAGAAVFSVDGPEREETKSGPDGGFTLSKFADAPAWVFARKAGYRLALAEVTPGQPGPAALTLVKADDPPAPAPVITAEHRAASERLTRHLLTRLWESGPDSGGIFALGYAAQYDLALARKWRDEAKARPGGRDYSGYVEPVARRKELAATAAADIEEAVAALAGMKGGAYDEALALARSLLATDKEKAARVAEEVAVRARERKLPEKVLSLADAGELAAQAGNAAGGKKLLGEAADLAEKLDFSGQTRTTMYAGMVAARLAPYDWPRAEAMLDRLTVPGEYNRWLSSAYARLAAADPARAKELLGKFKPDNAFDSAHARVKGALAVAATRPDEAEALIPTISSAGNRLTGHVALAERFAKTDRPRALRQIELAFAMIDADDPDLRSWSGMGGRAAFGAAAAAHAARFGHPGLADLVARTLAARPTPRDDYQGVKGREHALVVTASALALVDPASARRVLAGVAPPGEFAERAMSERREWLFALALADPDRAVGLVDKLFEQSKNPAAGGPTNTGLTTLAALLTGADRLDELERWGGLPGGDHDRE